MAMSMIMVILEVADHDPGFAQAGPMVAVEALLA
jgi:hypothetical protein